MNNETPGDARTSKTLSYWLRHAPERAGLQLDKEGWADSATVIAALNASGISVDNALLRGIVSRNEKQRFELSLDGTRIRARQGHSVDVEAGWTTASPPYLLYHGTVERFVATISKDGLLPQSRHHVHLSLDVTVAKQVGSRRGTPVIFQVAAQALEQAGGTFLKASNGVWLVAHVPSIYLKLMKSDNS